MREWPKSRPCASLRQPFPVPLQGIENRFVILLPQIRSADDNDIDTAQFVTIDAKTLTNHPFDTITLHRGFGHFTGNRHAQTGKTQSIGSSEHRKPAIGGSLGPLEDASKIGLASQPGAPFKARAAHT